jgi:signal transduction histidine kinase
LGSDRIVIRVLATPGGVRLEVEDNGPGIAEKDQEKIFEPYVRVLDSEPGLGLGLTTVKRIIEARGGRVGLRSTLHRGSCFWFELPSARQREDGRPERTITAA